MKYIPILLLIVLCGGVKSQTKGQEAEYRKRFDLMLRYMDSAVCANKCNDSKKSMKYWKKFDEVSNYVDIYQKLYFKKDNKCK